MGGVGNVGVAPMFYDYMLVYQGSSIKSSLPEFRIFLSALFLAAFVHPGCQEMIREQRSRQPLAITYPMARQAASQHSVWLDRQSAHRQDHYNQTVLRQSH